MTQVDPWVDQLVQLFGGLDENLSLQEREIIRQTVKGRSREIARNLTKENVRETKFINGSVKQWSESGLQDSYMRGAIRVSGEPLEMTRQQRREFQEIQKDVREKLEASVKYQKRDTERFVKEARRNPEPSRAWMERHQIKGVEFSDGRRMDIDAYAEMQAKTAAQKMFNLGTIHAAQKAGVQFLEVVDGPECGWEGHHDSEPANGKIIQNDEDIILVSHPYCVRTFVPRPDLNKGLVERAGRRVGKAIKTSAIATAQAEALPLLGKMLFVVEDEIVDQVAAEQLLLFGSRQTLFLNNLINRVINMVKSQHGPDADIIPLFGGPPEPLPAVAALGGTGTTGPVPLQLFKDPEPIATALAGQVSVETVKDNALKWADAVAEKRLSFDRVPGWVKAVVQATNNDSEGKFMERVRHFADLVQKERVKKLHEEGARAINFILKKKQWNEFIILKTADRFATEIRGTWTQYGPRITTDFTDFLRGRVTFTKDGIRRSITLSPAAATRATLGVAQDGTLIGSLRFVPNHFFSAAAEINDFGNLESEVRFNAFKGGRMRILFESPRPKNWEREGLVAGQDFVDFREGARSIAGHHEDWTADLTNLSKEELENKWGQNKSYQRFQFLIEHVQDPNWYPEFKEAVDNAVAEGFTDNRDVQLWLSVLADLEDTSTPRLYRGIAWDPSLEEDIILPKEMTRKEILTELDKRYSTGTRLDEFYASWSSDRGEAAEYAVNQANTVRREGNPTMPILFRLKQGARGIQENKFIQDEEWVFYDTPWSAGGSYVVRKAKYDSHIKEYVVDLEFLPAATNEVLAGRRFGVEDFTFKELFGELKKMRPKDIIFDVPIFNKSIVDLSAELKIPIDKVRKYVKDQLGTLLVRGDRTGRFSGQLSFHPGLDLVNMISNEASKSQIMGSLSFSQYLPTWASFLEPKVGATWTRTVKEIMGKETAMQRTIANVRLSGLEFFERATNMELASFFEIGTDQLENFARASNEVAERIRLFLIKNQRDELKVFGNVILPKGKLLPRPLMKPRDIAALIEKRLQPIVERPDINSRLDVFQYLVDAIRGESLRTVTRITRENPETGIIEFVKAVEKKPPTALANKILRQVANINQTDSVTVIENKLQDTMFFLRAMTLDDDNISLLLDGIEDSDLHLAAIQLSTVKNQSLEIMNDLFRHGERPFVIPEIVDDAVSNAGEAWLDSLNEEGISEAFGIKLPDVNYTADHIIMANVDGRRFAVEVTQDFDASDPQQVLKEIMRRTERVRLEHDRLRAALGEDVADQLTTYFLALNQSPMGADVLGTNISRKGTSKSITVLWHGRDADPGIQLHEFGHAIDRMIADRNPQLRESIGHSFISGTWDNAQDDDLVFLEQRLETLVLHNGNPRNIAWREEVPPDIGISPMAAISGVHRGITDYSDDIALLTGYHEDFADSFNLFIVELTEGSLGFDTDTGESIHFWEFWPNRWEQMILILRAAGIALPGVT